MHLAPQLGPVIFTTTLEELWFDPPLVAISQSQTYASILIPNTYFEALSASLFFFGTMDSFMLQDEATKDRIRQAEEFLDPRKLY